MTISVWQDSPVPKKTTAVDILVIGAGIIGAASAYWLQKKKNKYKLAVVDAQQRAMGASGRNGGFILRGIVAYYNQAAATYGRDTARWIFQFNEETQEYMRSFVKQNGNSFNYDESGSYLLACSLEELQNLEESAQLMKEDGFNVDYIKEDPLDRGFWGALNNPQDAGVHPLKLVDSLLAASEAEVFEGEQVFSIKLNEDKSLSVYTPQRIFTCQKVLLATNAYTPLLINDFEKILEPVRGQVLVTRPLNKKFIPKLCYANYGYEYFRQLPDNRLLLGGCREPFRHEEVGFADSVSSNVQNALQHYLNDRFPEIAGSRIDYRWSGIMSFSKDGLPLVGEIHDKPGVFFALGCNGHGMGYSMALARLLCQVAVGEADPGIFDAYRQSSGLTRTAIRKSESRSLYQDPDQQTVADRP